MILVIASMGTERIAPGIPHIQNQKTSEMMTRTGLRVKRLARSIGVTVSPSTKCNPTYNPAGSSACQSGVGSQHTSEKENHHSQSSPEDRHIIQQKGHSPPED